jgi:anaerobic selenocysteine-containing dehydrogenase
LKKDGHGEYFPWNSDKEVVEHLLKPSKMTLKDLEEHPEGIWFGERCYDVRAKNQIRTPSGKVELYSQTLADAGYDPIRYKEPPGALDVTELAKKYPLLNTGARMQEYTLADEACSRAERACS